MNQELIKNSLKLLIKNIPVDIVKNNSQHIDNFIDTSVDIVAEKQYEDPINFVKSICKVIPIEIIQNNPELIEKISQIIVNKEYRDAQTLFQHINELCNTYQDKVDKQNGVISENDANNAEQFILYFVNNIACSKQKVVNFLLELSSETILSLFNAINDLKIRETKIELSKINSSIIRLKLGLSNPIQKERYWFTVHDDLIDIYSHLKDLFEFYSSKIQELNSHSLTKYLIKGICEYANNNLNTNIQISKLAMSGIIQTLNLQLTISHYLDININLILKDFKDLSKKILSNKINELLQAYDEDQKSNYWKNLSNKLKDFTNDNKLLLEYLKS